MAGHKPFFMQDGQLCLSLRPVLPGWLFAEDGTITFKFLGDCEVIYHNPQRLDTFRGGLRPHKITLHTEDEHAIVLSEDVIGAPYATKVREGQIPSIHVYF